MRRKNVFVMLVAGALLAGCGGGGGQTTPTVKTSAPPSSPQGKPAGRGTLTIQFPGTFKRAAKAGKTAQKPAYVNPTAGNLLDIYVDGTLQTNLDGVTPTDSATVLGGGDGTQTLSIPLYSTATNDIAVVEWDSGGPGGGYLLAAGENATTPSFSPGTAPIIALSMLMNVQGIAISTSSSGSLAVQLSQSVNTFTVGCGVNPPTSNLFFLFATDVSGGFVVPNAPATTGYGGSVQAVVSSSTPSITTPPVTSLISYNGGYGVTYDSGGNPITIYATVPNNPAAVLFNNSILYPSFWNGLYYLTSYVQNATSTATLNNGYFGALIQNGGC